MDTHDGLRRVPFKETNMGIELELHSERPAWTEWETWETSRATVLQGSYEHGKALAQVLAALLGSNRTGRLCSVTPFDDTLFTEHDAEAALLEVPGLLPLCLNASQTAAVHDLARLLAACAAMPGSYLWFMGD
ncbi:hypothetical protein [Catenulispora pinisilvae]|uniref:hypothetical protein n=1 Tax=Catenulispora pinisilvae TaxID=2705253 RepID=UPI001E3D86C9|nr:hypothetical protein [Catenulispora pinisilvae]